MNQFRSVRGVTLIARIQKVSRQMVYKLINKFKNEGVSAYKTKKVGRPSLKINPSFEKKIISLRGETDYGCEKLHFVSKKEGFNVSQRQIQKILDVNKLTDSCLKRRSKRKYVRYQWPFSNYIWHCDWNTYEGKEYCIFIDDRSRKIMAAGVFDNATTKNALFVLYQAILNNGVCPVIILSDKGSRFYANQYDKKGNKGMSKFEKELEMMGIDFWTSRRNHPQTNGKMEKWFDTMKKKVQKTSKRNTSRICKMV